MTKSLVKTGPSEIAIVAMRDSTNQQLAKYEAGMLACVETADWAQVAKGAGSLEILARRHDLGQSIEDHAFAIKTEAERGLGIAMAASEKATGSAGQIKGKKKGSSGGTPGTRLKSKAPSYAEQGVDKALANKARRMAELTGAEVNAVAARDKTLAAVTREKTAAVREQRISLPDAKYRVVLADPPWDYNDKADAGAVQGKGAEHHYPAMSIDELCALDVKSICDQDAVLFLWVTSPLLFECQPVVGAWGFTYRASFVWDKVKHNMGHYNSVRHEFLLICGRGACAPVAPTLYDSVQVIERTEHSAKPEAFRDIIDDLYPSGKRIELFARRDVDGWDRYGKELLRDEAR